MPRQQIDLRDELMCLRRQFDRLWPLITLVYALVVIAFVFVVIARIRTGIPIADFTVDPLIAAGGFPVYTGILATMIGLVWAATVGVLLFAWAMVRQRSVIDIDTRFLLAAAAITFMLMIDDVFLGHEIIYPQYLRIPENLVYVIYGLTILWFLYHYLPVILRTDYLLLVLSLLGFGVSILTDVVYELDLLPVQGVFVLEDGSKNIAVVSWAAYMIRTGAQYVSSWACGRSPSR